MCEMCVCAHKQLCLACCTFTSELIGTIQTFLSASCRDKDGDARRSNTSARFEQLQTVIKVCINIQYIL